MADLDLLEQAQDSDPSDLDLRRARADWYDEAADDVMAVGLRQMAEEGLYPLAGPHNGPGSSEWGWCRLSWSGPWPSHARVGDGMWDALTDGHSAARRAFWDTRRAAEEALCRALAAPRGHPSGRHHWGGLK